MCIFSDIYFLIWIILNINNFHTTKSQQRKNNLLTLAISPAAIVPAPLSQGKEKNIEKQIEVAKERHAKAVSKS
jgi:hypothetical protein